MSPKSKSKRGIAPTINKTKGKAGKKKHSQPLYSDMIGTTKNEEKHTLRDMMSNMGTMLTTWPPEWRAMRRSWMTEMTQPPHRQSSQPSLKPPPARM